jgi:cytidylate kinase
VESAQTQVPPRGLVVALDGPASSGKSSVGAAAAKELGYRFCDTGLLYRAVTWLAMHRDVPAASSPALVGLVDEIRLLDVGDGRLAHVAIDGVDRTDDVRGPEVDVAVSRYSSIAELRSALLGFQRSLAADGKLIMAGRDIGTVVLPDADLKIYLDAPVEERAGRRASERGFAAGSAEATEILAELRRRDQLDSGREVAPLRKASDAVVLNTAGNAFETTVTLVIDAIRRAEGATAPAARRERAPRAQRRPIRQSAIATRMTFLISAISWVMRLVVRLIARFRIEGDIAGVPRTGPVIMAANHASSADPVLIGAFLGPILDRPLNWLGKRELFEMPVMGWLLRNGGIHPVDREAADLEAFRAAMRVLEAGQMLAIFPEGTRSRDGALQQVREGAGMLALRSGAQVLPVAVIDSDRMWPRGHLLPRFGRKVVVRYGAPFNVAELLDAQGLPSRGRQATEAATRLIMTRIAELLPPRQRGVYATEVESS